MDASSPRYLGQVQKYLNSEGWRTSSKQVREGTFLILAVRDSGASRERMLAMVVTAKEGRITEGHLKYLLKMGKKKETDKKILTAEFGVDEKTRQIGERHQIEIVDSTLVTESSSGEFSAGAEDFAFPDSEGNSDANLRSSTESDESEDSGFITRRRVVVGFGAFVGWIFWSGGGSEEKDSDSGDSATNNLQKDSPSGSDPTQSGDDLNAIKSEAKHIEYGELFRNIEQYEGEKIHYPASKIAQVIESSADKYDLRLNVTQNGVVWENDVLGRWEGERYLEKDLVEFWGIVKGPLQYEAVLGNQRTVPEIDIVDMNLLKKPSVSEGNVRVSEHELEIAEGEYSVDVSVKGVVVNESKIDINSLEVSARVVDSEGNQLESNTTYLSDVLAGSSAKFEIQFFVEADDIDSYHVEISDIT